MKYDGQIYKGPNHSCKDCPKRHLACHDSCMEYIQARAEWDAWRRLVKYKKHLAKQIRDHQVEQVLKHKWR